MVGDLAPEMTFFDMNIFFLSFFFFFFRSRRIKREGEARNILPRDNYLAFFFSEGDSQMCRDYIFLAGMM